MKLEFVLNTINAINSYSKKRNAIHPYFVVPLQDKLGIGFGSVPHYIYKRRHSKELMTQPIPLPIPYKLKKL